MDGSLYLIAGACLLASQHLPRDALRRPVEFAQYTCNEYMRMLGRMRSQPSVGRTGVCWDNALAESTNGSVKKEAIHPETFTTKAEVEPAVRRYLRYFNLDRRHSRLGYLTPAEFEDAHAQFGNPAA